MKFVSKAIALLIGILPALASTQGTSPTPAARTDAPAAEFFFKLPAYSHVSLSPDGKYLAALVPYKGRQNLAIIDLQTNAIKSATTGTDVDVVNYQWLGTNTYEITSQDLDQAGGATTVYLHDVIDVTTNRAVRNLMTISKFGVARVLTALDKEGYDLVIETFDRGIAEADNGRARVAHSPDAYRYNIENGRKNLLTFESPGDVLRFVADRKGEVRIAVSEPRGTDRIVVSYRRTNDDKWKVIRDERETEASFDPVAFDFDDRTLFVRVPDKEHAGRRAIYAYDTETGQMGPRVFEAADIDAGGTIPDWVQRKIVGFQDGIDDAWTDPKWKQTQASIDQALPHARNRMSWGKYNTDKILVRTETDAVPPKWMLFDRTKLTLGAVATAFPWLKEDDLSPRTFVHYKARDGLTIPAYLTMPKHPDGTTPPLIVNIHGGPFVSTQGYGYSAEAQYFASRGYAVLEPDFRGTIGYGKDFEQAGYRQWGLAMQDDVTDGVKWLIESGKVDADRVCLYGASYGGYATLWGLEKDPSMYRCGVAFLAVSNLEFLFDVNWSDTQMGNLGGSMERWLTVRVGDPATDRDKMRAVSPIYHADRIQAPLLLAYGATDVRVPLIHGNEMKSALDRAHKPYEWVVYGEQQHMRFDPVNTADFYRRVDAFLRKNLAPRPKTAAAATTDPQSSTH